MALNKIVTDGTETGGTLASKINLGFDITDATEITANNNAAAIMTNATAISDNTTAITGNTSEIGVLFTNQQHNTTAIMANTTRIVALETGAGGNGDMTKAEYAASGTQGYVDNANNSLLVKSRDVTQEIDVLGIDVTNAQSGVNANLILIDGKQADLGFGTAGQVLATNSSVNGTEWITPTSGSGGQVDSVRAGTNVSVDNTDPINPIVSATDTVYDDTALAQRVSDNETDIGGHTTVISNNVTSISNLTQDKEDKLTYGTAGQVLTVNPTADGYVWGSGSGGSGGQVDSVVAGTNVTVDNTDPINPIVSSTDTVYDDTALESRVAINDGKISNIDHPLVETAVPVGALFTDTDTVYDDSGVVKIDGSTPITAGQQIDGALTLSGDNGAARIQFSNTDGTTQFIQDTGQSGSGAWSVGRLTQNDDKVTLWNNTTSSDTYVSLRPTGKIGIGGGGEDYILTDSVNTTLSGNLLLSGDGVAGNSTQIQFNEKTGKGQFVHGYGTDGTSRWSMGRLTEFSDKVTLWNNTTATDSYVSLRPDGEIGLGSGTGDVVRIAQTGTVYVNGENPKVFFDNTDGGNHFVQGYGVDGASTWSMGRLTDASDKVTLWNNTTATDTYVSLRPDGEIGLGGGAGDYITFDPTDVIFTSIPSSATAPTVDDHLVNKLYVDTNAVTVAKAEIVAATGVSVQGYDADTVIDASYVSHTIAAAVADIATPSTATAEDVANKVNALLASLRTAGILAV